MPVQSKNIYLKNILLPEQLHNSKGSSKMKMKQKNDFFQLTNDAKFLTCFFRFAY